MYRVYCNRVLVYRLGVVVCCMCLVYQSVAFEPTVKRSALEYSSSIGVATWLAHITRFSAGSARSTFFWRSSCSAIPCRTANWQLPQASRFVRAKQALHFKMCNMRTSATQVCIKPGVEVHSSFMVHKWPGIYKRQIGPELA